MGVGPGFGPSVGEGLGSVGDGDGSGVVSVGDGDGSGVVSVGEGDGSGVVGVGVGVCPGLVGCGVGGGGVHPPVRITIEPENPVSVGIGANGSDSADDWLNELPLAPGAAIDGASAGAPPMDDPFDGVAPPALATTWWSGQVVAATPIANTITAAAPKRIQENADRSPHQ